MKIPVLHQIRKAAARFFILAEEGNRLIERPVPDRQCRPQGPRYDEFDH